MHIWVDAVTKALNPLRDSQNAADMSAYMRDQFAFFGINAAARRTAVKPLLLKNTRPSIDELSEIIQQLWQLPEREYQLVALDLMIKVKRQLPLLFVHQLELCIIQKSWWDTVDLLATHITGELFGNFPDQMEPLTHHWQQSENVWLRRTTLLYQLKYKERTDFTKLSRLILLNSGHKDFFIQKAIGWALREYSKNCPDKVIAFIKQHNLSGLATREGLKWINRK